jgi:hypothetical protein
MIRTLEVARVDGKDLRPEPIEQRKAASPSSACN